jgi:hypothetical protein
MTRISIYNRARPMTGGRFDAGAWSGDGDVEQLKESVKQYRRMQRHIS